MHRPPVRITGKPKRPEGASIAGWGAQEWVQACQRGNVISPSGDLFLLHKAIQRPASWEISFGENRPCK